MADFFGAIASKEIGSKRVPLVFPTPTPKNGISLPLEKANGSSTPVYKKPDTREELDAIIEELRIKYTPFLQKLAPELKETREKIILEKFDLREATQDDLLDFSRVLCGEGEWESISVPYYFGPTGNTVHYYRTTFNITKKDASCQIFSAGSEGDRISSEQPLQPPQPPEEQPPQPPSSSELPQEFPSS